jgi:hypothetical protein
MAQSAPARTKINTKVTQPAPGRSSRRPAGRPGPGRPPRGSRVSGDARESVRQPDRPVIELDFGILVYPPETDGEPWRAVFTENGQRKYRQGATEAKLAAKLEKVRERLSAGAANMERPGADLIRHYLDPDRLPAQDRWSRKHAHTQRRLCERFAAPVIDAVTCQDIKTWHTQQIVNAAPTAGEGDRVRGMLSALVAAGIEGGYLTNQRLAMVHWQAAGVPLLHPGEQVFAAMLEGWRAQQLARNLALASAACSCPVAAGRRSCQGAGRWSCGAAVFCRCTWRSCSVASARPAGTGRRTSRVFGSACSYRPVSRASTRSRTWA